MQRRDFLTTATAAFLTSFLRSPLAAQPVPPKRTQWKVRQSEGFDAITFLGAFAGGDLYLRFYAEDAAIFKPRLPVPVSDDISRLWHEAATAGFGLLGPNLCVLFSNGNDMSLDVVLEALDDRDRHILPSYKVSQNWSEKDWNWFVSASSRLKIIFTAMRDAGFAEFRRVRSGNMQSRVDETQRSLKGFDVISLQEKLTGRTFNPTIEVVLLKFSQPHGIRVQGQTFLQSEDYDPTTTVRIAAHEMLHPPVQMDGTAAKSALAVLARDPLMTRIVKEHDPKWGYTSLEGILNEDLVQALDQLIDEALGVARNPADRWRESDDGMHVLAGGLYGLLRESHWVVKGGSIETWLGNAARSNRLSPAILHPVAALVLERPVDRLWPLSESAKVLSAPKVP